MNEELLEKLSYRNIPFSSFDEDMELARTQAKNREIITTVLKRFDCELQTDLLDFRFEFKFDSLGTSVDIVYNTRVISYRGEEAERLFNLIGENRPLVNQVSIIKNVLLFDMRFDPIQFSNSMELAGIWPVQNPEIA